MDDISIITGPILLGVGLLAPGWLLSRALGTPAEVSGAFIGSAALLMNLVLAFDTFGIRLDKPHIAAALTVICCGLAVIAQFRGGFVPFSPEPSAPRKESRHYQ